MPCISHRAVVKPTPGGLEKRCERCSQPVILPPGAPRWVHRAITGTLPAKVLA